MRVEPRRIVVLADDEQQLARVRSGSIKRLRVDAATAAANLDQALAELTVISGIDMDAITRTCIGTAGESVPLVADWLPHGLPCPSRWRASASR